MPETGIILKTPLYRIAWERAQRSGVPFQALGVQGDLMVIRRGFWSPPWYGEYQWLAGAGGRRQALFEILSKSGEAPGEAAVERFDFQYKGSPEFPSGRGLLVIADSRGISLAVQDKPGDQKGSLPKVPALVTEYSAVSKILDEFQAAFEKVLA